MRVPSRHEEPEETNVCLKKVPPEERRVVGDRRRNLSWKIRKAKRFTVLGFHGKRKPWGRLRDSKPENQEEHGERLS